MGYEVDFLPVGDGEKSGDCIAMRFGNLFGKREEQQVVVIDGGFQKSGEELVSHIRKYYNTEKVDLVISSHPDNDHSSGLSVVLEKMKVSELWMHQPWSHTNGIADMFEDGRVTDKSIKEKLQRSLEDAYYLESLAKSKNIPIKEPFVGLANKTNELYVIGPSKEYYDSLLPEFRSTSISKESSFLEKAITAIEGVLERVFENFNKETLDDSGETTAENNSGTVILLNHIGKKLLFTSDAGIPALTHAIKILDYNKINCDEIAFIQVPHHGSKRNVGPTVLNKILGNIKSEDKQLRTAFVSVAEKSDSKHPSKKVMNAFRRRGAYVFETKGQTKRYHKDAPPRPDYTAATPLCFYQEVED